VNNLSKLETYLNQNGLKMTNPRKVIIESLEDLSNHFTLEELFKAVERRRSGVGQATLYRTMRLLVEAEIVEEHRFDDGITRYEIQDDDTHHDHLICLSCGLIIEFEDELIEQRQEALAKKFGLHITTHKMELYGHCLDRVACRERSSTS